MEWTTAYVDALPDSAFAYVNGTDRRLPYRDKDGTVDPAHLRNALARLNQTAIPAAAKARALAKLRRAAKSVGVTVSEALASDSLDGRAEEIRDAWGEAAGMMWDPDKDGDPGPGWVTDVYDDALIVRDNGGDFYRVPYTLDADGDPVFGEATEVQVTFQAVQEALIRESAELLRPTDLTGAEWDARILRFGVSANGWEWTRESAESLLPLLEGAPVCAYPHGKHAPEATIAANNGPVREAIVGSITQPRIEPDGVYGRVRIAEAHAPLRARLLELAKGGVRAIAAGLSVDTLAAFVPIKVAEAVVKRIKQVKRLFSVDIVDAPSAGGGLIRATAGPISQEDTMKREELLALVRENRPQPLEDKDVATLTDEAIAVLVREAMKTPPAPAAAKKDEPKKDEPAVEPAWAREARAREVRGIVREAVGAATTLPELLRQRLIKRYEARVVEAAGAAAFEAEVVAAIKDEVETHAKLYGGGDPKGFGAPSIRMGAEPVHKLQAAMDRLFLPTEFRGKNYAHAHEAFDAVLASGAFLSADTPGRVREAVRWVREAASDDPGLRFKSLRHSYEMLTGDEGVSGQFQRGRVSETIDSSTWTNILQNALYRRLLMTYAEPMFHERSIAEYGAAVDFRTKHVAILNYFGDIDVVDPESADYVEISAPSDADLSYAVSQRGNILTVTRKVLINDDLRALAQMVSRLGRAARRTLAKRIWTDLWVANIAYGPDTLAWFESGTHKNTGSTALSADAAGAAEVLAKVQQLADMTEQGSGAKLGLPPMDSLWLDVPHTLFGVATTLNGTPFLTAATPVANPVYHYFGVNNERINCNPLLTDTTDWGVHVSPGGGGRESVLVDFLQGREEPEFFLADVPTIGQMFVGDKLQWKLRHEYGAILLDFRGATKEVVAGA
jgi:hypothetical protein